MKAAKEEKTTVAQKLCGGIDWLEWTASVDWSTDESRYWFNYLEALKAQCQEDRQPSAWLEVPSIGKLRVYRMGEAVHR